MLGVRTDRTQCFIAINARRRAQETPFYSQSPVVLCRRLPSSSSSSSIVPYQANSRARPTVAIYLLQMTRSHKSLVAAGDLCRQYVRLTGCISVSHSQLGVSLVSGTMRINRARRDFLSVRPIGVAWATPANDDYLVNVIVVFGSGSPIIGISAAIAIAAAIHPHGLLSLILARLSTEVRNLFLRTLRQA